MFYIIMISVTRFDRTQFIPISDSSSTFSVLSFLSAPNTECPTFDFVLSRTATRRARYTPFQRQSIFKKQEEEEDEDCVYVCVDEL